MRILISILFLAILHASTLSAHNCGIDGCEFNGMAQFESRYEEGTDGYLYDLTHWQHPDWSWSHIEEHVMELDHACYENASSKPIQW